MSLKVLISQPNLYDSKVFMPLVFLCLKTYVDKQEDIQPVTWLDPLFRNTDVDTMLKGINLKQYLKKRNLSIDESILLCKTLLSMSEYLLKFNLVHGDIKPENIIVIQRNSKKIFKIIDFGSITEIFSISNKLK